MFVEVSQLAGDQTAQRFVCAHKARRARRCKIDFPCTAHRRGFSLAANKKQGNIPWTSRSAIFWAWPPASAPPPVLPPHGEAQAQGRRPGPAGRPIPTGDRGLANMNVQPSTVDWNYKPRRINKAIELWEDGQPIYYNGSGLGPGVDPYAQGVKMARTWYDAINVEFEHGAMDFTQLREFMRGLVDGGPTRSGHRTPAVFVETGIIGLDEAYARANSWMIEPAAGLRHSRHSPVPCPRHQGGAGDHADGLPLSLQAAGHQGSADARPARLRRRLCRPDLGRGPVQVQSCRRSVAAESQGRADLRREDRGHLLPTSRSKAPWRCPACRWPNGAPAITAIGSMAWT